MTSTINPQQLTVTEQSSLGRFSFTNISPTVDNTDNGMMDDNASPSPTTASLPGRVTTSATAHAQNRALRIDTEQLRRLSICDTGSHGHRTRSSVASLRHHQFQKFREQLWTKGRDSLGDRSTPHYNIAPVRLPTTPDTTNESITIYTVVHSQGHSPIGLRRRFDRGLLTATVPEPFQSPATPNFDRDELLSAIADTNKTLASRRFRQSTRRASLPIRAARSRQESTAPIPEGIPMHFTYARAQLPILASIMMSKQVRVGDTIELPLPHPEAWAETVAWVYIGEEKLATEKVQENIQYLGGRVC